MMIKSIARVVLIVCTGLLAGGKAVAGEFQFNGFISQSVIYSPDNPWYVDGESLHGDFREFALNARYAVNDRLSFTGQVLSRKVGDIDDGSPQLDFALADINLLSHESLNLGVRLGRVKNPYGLFNSARDVPHARTGVFVPQAVYFETFRDALLRVDGGELYGEFSGAAGNLGFYLFGGTADLTNNVIEYQIYQNNIRGSFDQGDVTGLKVTFNPELIPELLLVYSHMEVDLSLEGVKPFTTEEILQGFADLAANPTNFSRYISSTEIHPTIDLYSLQYSASDWIFSAEFLNVHIEVQDVELLGIAQPGQSQVLQSYYLQSEWLAHKQLNLYARYEDLVYNKDDRKGEASAARTGGNPVLLYNRAVTLGARWFFTPNASVTAELSDNRGAAFLSGPDSVDYAAFKERWKLLVIQFSYHF